MPSTDKEIEPRSLTSFLILASRTLMSASVRESDCLGNTIFHSSVAAFRHRLLPARTTAGSHSFRCSPLSPEASSSASEPSSSACTAATSSSPSSGNALPRLVRPSLSALVSSFTLSFKGSVRSHPIQQSATRLTVVGVSWFNNGTALPSRSHHCCNFLGRLQQGGCTDLRRCRARGRACHAVAP